MAQYTWLHKLNILNNTNLWIVFDPGQNLLPTELQYSDGFAQLATHLLLEVNYNTGNVTVYIVMALSVKYFYHYEQ